MSHLIQLRQYAREIFDHALEAVDPCRAVQQAVKDGPVSILCRTEPGESSRHIYAIALGKAATSMALGLDSVIGEKIAAGVLSGPANSTNLLESNRWQTFIGGHPLPNEASLAAARSVFTIMERAYNEHALVIFLVSGGGSAMIEWPVSEDITLEDLRRANEVLVACGARISEINSVRRAFSAVKGGGLARYAPHAEIATLIVSDTNPGDEANVASGPTLPAPRDAPKPMDVIEQYRLELVLPASILRAVHKASDSAFSQEQIETVHHVLLDNMTAMEAAGTKALDFVSSFRIADGICEQPVEEGCDLLLSTFLPGGTPQEGGSCLISGGEFSCPVRGEGRGGRNLETVLRCAIGLDQTREGRRQHTVVFSAGTDGIDGNTPAAGAIADEITIERARKLGLNPIDFLARSDSYAFFEKLDDLVVTGPTGTNVRDLRILLKSD